MATVRSDDAARSLRFVYLGPPNSRWPAAPLPAYGLFFVVALFGIVVAFLTRPNLGVFLFIEAPLVIGLSVLAVRAIFRRIDADTPLAYQIQTLKAEITAPRPPKARGPHCAEIRPTLFIDRDTA